MSFCVAADGVRIHYALYPEIPNVVSALPPLVLQHGFTGDHVVDFVETGLIDELVSAGRNVVALDARGHGGSDAPQLAGSYGNQRMARDVMSLADHLGVQQYDLLGFSMGGYIGLWVAAFDHRVRKLILTGVGGSVVTLGRPDPLALDLLQMADWLDAANVGVIEGTGAADYIAYADSRGLDRAAIAACARGLTEANRYPFAEIQLPCLLLVGDADPLVEQPELLASALPSCELQIMAGDHVSVLANPQFAPAIARFCAEDRISAG